MQQSRLPHCTIERTRGGAQDAELDRTYVSSRTAVLGDTGALDEIAAVRRAKTMAAAIQRAAKERHDARVEAERLAANMRMAEEKSLRDASEREYYQRPNLLSEVSFSHPLEPARDRAAQHKAKSAIGKELRAQMRRNARKAARKKRSVVTQQNFFLSGVKKQCVALLFVCSRACSRLVALLECGSVRRLRSLTLSASASTACSLSVRSFFLPSTPQNDSGARRDGGAQALGSCDAAAGVGQPGRDDHAEAHTARQAGRRCVARVVADVQCGSAPFS